MKNTEYQKLKEASWRRPLTAAERAWLREWLAAHPEAQESWEAEAALNGLLRRLPGANVSSNFTARVMQAAQRAPARQRWGFRLGMFPWLPVGWMPRAALAAAMVCSGMLSWHEYVALHRTQEARAVASVSFTGGGMGASAKLLGAGANNPLIFFAAAVFLCAVATLASWLPARRAAAIDPMKALRTE